MPLWQCQVAVSERLGFAVNRAKVCAADTADELCPDFGVDDAVQIQAFFGIVAEGRNHAHLVQLERTYNTGHTDCYNRRKNIICVPNIIDEYSRRWDAHHTSLNCLLIQQVLS